MTVLVHTKKDIIFKIISEFFKEQGVLCEKFEGQPISSSVTCLIWDDSFEEVIPSLSVPILILENDFPVSLKELFESYQKSVQSKNLESFIVGPYHILPKSRQALCKEKNISLALTEKEIMILDALYHAKKPLTKEQLLKHVWGYESEIDTHTLETHMYKLRKKLSPHDPEALIVTSKEGYAFKP